ncbi:amino acid transporter [Aspergillus sclerotialis]|uniref:Amino acid transporter n=1 Tax=Aspergillus sclerotialis TaxID=2070753 RepID=A0A3A2ZQ36_9EURO|nr:amino acid transporter [Aspergillus sclerotialis]
MPNNIDTFEDSDTPSLRDIRDVEVPQEKLEKRASIEPKDTFGDEEHAEVKYKVLSWWQCGFLMIAESVSIGILSLPAVVAAIGLVPAIIIIAFLGLLATYTGYIIGQFRWRYPHVHNLADAGEVIAGKFGREVLGGGQLLLIIFVMASHLLTFMVAMNTITDHGTCTIVFGVVGLVISLVAGLPRTLKHVSTMSVVCFISVFSAVMIAMIAVGVQHPGSKLEAVVKTDVYHAFLAICNIVFSFSGHVAFFAFIAELKDPKDYPKSLVLLQGTDTSLYLVTAIVIYCYAGQDVTSPALGSAGPVVAKVAYGIALPTIIIGGVVNGHVAAKYVFVRLFRNTDRMHRRDWRTFSSWAGILAMVWIIAWIIAEAIPVFNDLLSLVASLFASWSTYGINSVFWLFMNKGRYTSSIQKMFLTVINLLIIGIAGCICGLGLYVSGKSLHDNPSSASFSCANNA